MRRLLISLFLITSLSSWAKESYYFTNLSLADGLSQITVLCIYQDSKGFMWFGTKNGLNRFDGYNFDVFTTNSQDNASISDNHIMSMAEDNKNNLWVGTNKGLNRLNCTTNKAEKYFAKSSDSTSLAHNSILSLYFDVDENLWVGTNNGLNLYDSKSNSFKQISLDGLLDNERINAITRSGNNLYIGTTNQGLVAYNIKSKKTIQYKNNPNDVHSISDNYVKCLHIDKDKNVWAGTHRAGVNVLRKGKDIFESYTEKEGLTNNYVRSICESPDGEILLATFNGLNTINPITNEIQQYKKYGSTLGNLSHYSIFSVYVDRAETLWVGTYAGGVCYYSKYGQKFQFYAPSIELKTVLGVLGPIVEQENFYYIATEGGGLLEIDKKTNDYKNYKIFNNSNISYSANIIKSLYIDNGRVLCGTNIGTVYSFDPRNKKFTQLYKSAGRNSIYHISRSKSGNLIVGEISGPGMVWISKNGKINNMFPIKDKVDMSFQDVRCILELDENVFLIGTRNKGLYHYDYNTHILKNYQHQSTQKNETSLPDNYITSIFEDSMGQIWIGTYGGGISQFDIDTGKFVTYDSNKNLLDNSVCAIVEDSSQHLWISTLSGISEFDLKTKEINNYTHSNGIKIDEFSLHAGIKLSNNNIAFSGNNGFVSFNPKRISTNPHIPPINLKKLYVNNVSIQPGAEDKILDQPLNRQEKIELKHNQSNIIIEYNALNYVFANKNQYAYKLEGFDDNWNEVGERQTAYYTNIPPGKYRFVVKGSNNDGVWNNEGASILINVMPPLWRTWWAYCLYIISLTAILMLIYRYFDEKKRLENDIKLQQMEVEAQEKFHEARNKLFTNFSHELRTPLTLIISPLEDMIEREKLPTKVEQTMILMRSNAKRILRLVNNLMDFQKKENGSMSLKISQGDFVQFTEEMTIFFNELAFSRKINFEFYPSVDNITYSFDRGLMEKVYFNFLSNAFKNVPNEGAIQVRINKFSFDELKKMIPHEKVQTFKNTTISYILLEIEDSGVGIDDCDLDKIFHPFYQVAKNEHSASGTGLGLSLSKSIIEMHHGVVWAESVKNIGSTFRCVLPIDAALFENEEKENLDLHHENSDLYSIEIPKQSKIESPESKKNHTILIVEDNVEIRNYIRTSLSDSYNLIVASNGEEGIDKATLALPDLIISDLMMPKMNGLEMCTQIKNDLRISHIPIILLTARSMDADIKTGYAVGADEYITKPFSSSILVARVDNIIQSRIKLKEIYSKRFSLESLGVEAVSIDDQFMQKLYSTLEQNISNPELNLDSFSQEIGMSRASFYRKIKSITGFSPSEFIRNFRLAMGAKMLKEAQLSVSDVFVAVGFNSHAYFSNCFKAQYGVSPTEYASQPIEEEI